MEDNNKTNIKITNILKPENAAYLLSALFETSNDAIIIKNLKGEVLRWNKSAEEMYGYSEEEMIGQSVKKIIPLDAPDSLDDILIKIGNGEKIENYETIRKAKDGKILDISLSISPIKDKTGEIIAAVTVARDITKLKLIEKDLKEKYENTEKLNKIMFDRELKMMELKKENQELKNKLESK